VFKLTNYKTAAQQADIIAFLVAHDEFKDLEISSDKVVLDFCGITSRDNKKLNGI
jgi:UDP-N-acetyl-D-mannosaminuronic acid dehydrogenase